MGDEAASIGIDDAHHDPNVLMQLVDAIGENRADVRVGGDLATQGTGGGQKKDATFHD